MALQVWLPLTKDLRNQGLSNVTVNGGTIDNNGKLGKCYLVTKTNPIVITQSISTTSEWTIAFWAKLPSSMNNATAWEVMFNFPTINADTGANGTSNINWASYHNVKIWDDANHQWFWAAPGTNFNYDQWHHWTIAHTANGNGVQGKIYIDGNLIGTYNNTTHQMKIRPGNITIGGGISTGGFYINDFRIYNHCLSPMEVKQLAQGLVLHYPLNRGGFGQENLITQAMINAEPWASAIQGNYTIDGKIGWILTNYQLYSKSGNGANNIFSGLTYDTNTQYTISFKWRDDYRTDGKSSSLYIRFKYSDGTYSQVISSKDYNYWKEEIMTSTAGKTVSAITTTYGNGGNLLFTDLKLEKGAIKTSFSPIVNSDLYNSMGLNGTTEYDCSGFCNNGTRTGTFSWTSDTPKYSVSTKFNTNYIERNNVINNPSTTAFWIKFDSLSNQIVFTDYNTVASLGIYNNNLLIGYGSECKLTYPKTIITTDKWYHICIVKSSNTTAEFYLDGILQTPGSTTDYWTRVGTNSQIGARSTNYYFKGNLSDFRIYATALSADDVKSLYQNCATIDADGTIHGQIRS